MLTDLPELVPARMLNEFAYCPRLFFLEWVDSLWESSVDVAEGDRLHRRADAGGGSFPSPASGPVKVARSVELASERLGITAKLDLVEGSGGQVVPVDVMMVVDLGHAGDSSRFLFLGNHHKLPSSSAAIV